MLALLAAAACRSQPTGAGPRVALVMKTPNNPFFIDMQKGAQEAATRLGVQLVVQSPEREVDVEKQMQIVENLIETGIQALCIAPASSKGILPALAKANRAKVPIVVVDDEVDQKAAAEAGVRTDSYVGSDNVEGGRLAGRHLVESTGGKASVAVLEGIPGHETGDSRLSGFREALRAAPGVKVLVSQTANWERDQGFSVFQNMLQAHPQIDAVFACNDMMALGAVEAIQAAGKTGSIRVIGFDAVDDARKAIAAGTMAASIAQFPQEMGRIAVEAAVKLLRGEPVPRDQRTKIGLVTKDSLRWTPQTSGVTARLRGVSAVSADVAWASGANGTVLVTSDGGRNWRRLSVPGADALDFRDVDAIDAKVAYALSIGPGEASRIYKTKDGGVSWDEQFVNRDPEAFFDAMAFWDERHGVAVSDSVDGRFVILRTEDGGRRWSPVPASGLPAAMPGEGAFAASGTNVAVLGRDRAWFATGAGRVLHTRDRGRTWQIARAPLASGASAGIFSIAFRDARHGVVVGGDYRKEDEAVQNAAFSEDGGVTWKAATGLTGFRSVVAYRPGARGSFWIALGPQGADVSRDDGRSWSAAPAPGCHAFSFARDGSTGYCVGENGRIARLESSLEDPR